MLIDEFMTSWDVVKRYEIQVGASPIDTLAAARQVDLGSDRLVGFLLRIRGLRRPATTWMGLAEAGFIPLADTDEELLVGIVGRFWTPGGGLRPLSGEEFRRFDEPGYAKATWNFAVEPVAESITCLSTETRILCTDRSARRKFRAYWAVVGPFSGLIRSRALRQIRVAAEST